MRRTGERCLHFGKIKGHVGGRAIHSHNFAKKQGNDRNFVHLVLEDRAFIPYFESRFDLIINKILNKDPQQAHCLAWSLHFSQFPQDTEISISHETNKQKQNKTFAEISKTITLEFLSEFMNPCSQFWPKLRHL
jgi:hypothetical protein